MQQRCHVSSCTTLVLSCHIHSCFPKSLHSDGSGHEECCGAGGTSGSAVLLTSLVWLQLTWLQSVSSMPSWSTGALSTFRPSGTLQVGLHSHPAHAATWP